MTKETVVLDDPVSFKEMKKAMKDFKVNNPTGKKFKVSIFSEYDEVIELWLECQT